MQTVLTTAAHHKRADKLCKCACGEQASGRSRYYDNHGQIMAMARRRYGRIRRRARHYKIEFKLRLKDVRDLIFTLPDMGATCYFERIDRRRGFVPGNVIATQRKGAAAKITPPSKAKTVQIEVIADRLQRLIDVQFGKNDVPPLSIQDLIDQWEAQDGKCALSGVALQIDRRFYPDAASITRPNPSEPWSKANFKLVCFCLKVVVDKWGDELLVRMAARIAKKNTKTGETP